MVSFIASSTAHHLSSPVVSILGLGTNFKIRPRVSFMVVIKDCVWGYKELKETRTRSGFLCQGSFDSEAELVLEREILLFMKNSRNPNEFPTKKELLDAGRVDLVNAITKRGGWLSLGWDYSDVENDLKNNDYDDVRELRTRIESFQQRNDEDDPSSCSFSSCHQSAALSGKSLEMVAEEDTGVEGILSRLKKHRSLSFDVRMEKNRYGTYASRKDNGGLTDLDMSTDVGKSTAQGTWRIPRRHFSDFEAAEIDYGKEDSKDKKLSIQCDSELQERHEVNPNQIRSRLQRMQLELSSALLSLGSKSQTLNSVVHESRSSELQQLSDVWEFQENELMKAKDKLRSIRAKLAVFEGKIALSLIDAQKLVEEKQRRIDSARRTLKLLCTTCIFWTHSASEVFLVGSFDGWTSQRKMEKRSRGIFSFSLKLYPGRYEIKFIVDGIWRVDPMLPIVHNNGYENNSLIVHEQTHMMNNNEIEQSA